MDRYMFVITQYL